MHRAQRSSLPDHVQSAQSRVRKRMTRTPGFWCLPRHRTSTRRLPPRRSANSGVCPQRFENDDKRAITDRPLVMSAGASPCSRPGGRWILEPTVPFCFYCRHSRIVPPHPYGIESAVTGLEHRRAISRVRYWPKVAEMSRLPFAVCTPW